MEVHAEGSCVTVKPMTHRRETRPVNRPMLVEDSQLDNPGAAGGGHDQQVSPPSAIATKGQADLAEKDGSQLRDVAISMMTPTSFVASRFARNLPGAVWRSENDPGSE